MITIYDDTSRGDTFEISKVLYEDKDILVGHAIHEDYKGYIPVMIYKDSMGVISKDLDFYIAKFE